MTLPDAAQRERALHGTTSFLVQAPAGSGKTALLTQRVLSLLGVVDQPEEVVAITFTRKAATEMRERVLGSLRRASAEGEPAELFRAVTWGLAQKVLSRDAELGWKLLQHPERLRITTIDGLCFTLLRTLEPQARLSFPETPAEQVDELYRQAARRTLEDRHNKAVTALLDHLDHNLPRAQQLLVEMLARRLGWLDQIGRLEGARPTLEGSVARVVGSKLQALEERLTEHQAEGLAAAARFSARQLGLDWPWLGLPGVEQSDVAGWRHVADICLKDNGEWRKTVNVKQGFPVGQDDPTEKRESKAIKKAFRALLKDELSGSNELREALDEVRRLPSAGYRENEWERLESLATVLQLAYHTLRQVFAQAGVVDFSEMASRAHRELVAGNVALTPAPRHLLVDEFQDTSLSQFKLLERLVLNWLPGDGRTLFLVGDPMQSIYRFREADVGLFERAKRHGIAHLQVEFLALQVNFRSHPELVDAFHTLFQGRFPPRDRPLHGAVSFASSVSGARPDFVGPALEVHPVLSLEEEAQEVCRVALALREQHPEKSMALLARSRTHLQVILRELRAREVPFEGVALETLADAPHVLDLHALTRALLNFDDRVAWLSLLRAPWCGLTSTSMLELARRNRFVWRSLQEIEHVRIEEAARRRCRHLVAALTPALKQRGRRPLRDVVEQAWTALKGPQILRRATELHDCERYLRLLEEMDHGGDVVDRELLEERLASLTSSFEPVGGRSLSVMTYHKSKGLEFDIVLLPGLSRRSGADQEQLLAWQEVPRTGGEIGTSDLLMAPLRAPGDEKSELAVFLEHIQRDRARHEELRLLYVACTRAISQLHLFGLAEVDPELGVVKEPTSGTYLDLIWSTVAPHFQVLRERERTSGVKAPDELRRLAMCEL